MGQQPVIVMELVATCMCNSMDLPHMLMYVSHFYVVCRNVVELQFVTSDRCVVCTQ